MPLHETVGETNTSSSSSSSSLTLPVQRWEKKTVTFQETTTIVRFHDYGECTWHGIEDRKRFLLEARREAVTWISRRQREGLSYDFLLKDTFHDTGDVFSAQEKIDAYVQLPGDDYCRGLERYVCREHGLKRDGFKRGAIRAIVNEGKKRKQRGMSIDKTWMQLGEISRHLSSTATKFARRVGIADENVVRYGEDPTKLIKLQEDLVEKTIITPTTTPASGASTSQQDSVVVVVGSSNNLDDNHRHRHHHNQQEQHTSKIHIECHNSQRSVTAVNVWCHGPRESCVPAVQVQQAVVEVANRQ